MKTNLKKIAFLSLVLLSVNVTVCAQYSIPVDTSGVWYTNKQDLNCLQCLVAEKTRKEQIEAFKKEVEQCHQDFESAVLVADACRIENVLLEEQLNKTKSQRNIAIGVGGAFAVLAVLLGLK